MGNVSGEVETTTSQVENKAIQTFTPALNSESTTAKPPVVVNGSFIFDRSHLTQVDIQTSPSGLSRQVANAEFTKKKIDFQNAVIAAVKSLVGYLAMIDLTYPAVIAHMGPTAVDKAHKAGITDMEIQEYIYKAIAIVCPVDQSWAKDETPETRTSLCGESYQVVGTRVAEQMEYVQSTGDSVQDCTSVEDRNITGSIYGDSMMEEVESEHANAEDGSLGEGICVDSVMEEAEDRQGQYMDGRSSGTIVEQHISTVEGPLLPAVHAVGDSSVHVGAGGLGGDSIGVVKMCGGLTSVDGVEECSFLSRGNLETNSQEASQAVAGMEMEGRTQSFQGATQGCMIMEDSNCGEESSMGPIAEMEEKNYKEEYMGEGVFRLMGTENLAIIQEPTSCAQDTPSVPTEAKELNAEGFEVPDILEEFTSGIDMEDSNLGGDGGGHGQGIINGSDTNEVLGSGEDVEDTSSQGKDSTEGRLKLTAEMIPMDTEPETSFTTTSSLPFFPTAGADQLKEHIVKVDTSETVYLSTVAAGAGYGVGDNRSGADAVPTEKVHIGVNEVEGAEPIPEDICYDFNLSGDLGDCDATEKVYITNYEVKVGGPILENDFYGLEPFGGVRGCEAGEEVAVFSSGQGGDEVISENSFCGLTPGILVNYGTSGDIAIAACGLRGQEAIFDGPSKVLESTGALMANEKVSTPVSRAKEEETIFKSPFHDLGLCRVAENFEASEEVTIVVDRLGEQGKILGDHFQNLGLSGMLMASGDPIISNEGTTIAIGGSEKGKSIAEDLFKDSRPSEVPLDHIAERRVFTPIFKVEEEKFIPGDPFRGFRLCEVHGNLELSTEVATVDGFEEREIIFGDPSQVSGVPFGRTAEEGVCISMRRVKEEGTISGDLSRDFESSGVCEATTIDVDGTKEWEPILKESFGDLLDGLELSRLLVDHTTEKEKAIFEDYLRGSELPVVFGDCGIGGEIVIAAGKVEEWDPVPENPSREAIEKYICLLGVESSSVVSPDSVSELDYAEHDIVNIASLGSTKDVATIIEKSEYADAKDEKCTKDVRAVLENAQVTPEHSIGCNLSSKSIIVELGKEDGTIGCQTDHMSGQKGVGIKEEGDGKMFTCNHDMQDVIVPEAVKTVPKGPPIKLFPIFTLAAKAKGTKTKEAVLQTDIRLSSQPETGNRTGKAPGAISGKYSIPSVLLRVLLLILLFALAGVSLWRKTPSLDTSTEKSTGISFTKYLPESATCINFVTKNPGPLAFVCLLLILIRWIFLHWTVMVPVVRRITSVAVGGASPILKASAKLFAIAKTGVQLLENVITTICRWGSIFQVIRMAIAVSGRSKEGELFDLVVEDLQNSAEWGVVMYKSLYQTICEGWEALGGDTTIIRDRLKHVCDGLGLKGVIGVQGLEMVPGEIGNLSVQIDPAAVSLGAAPAQTMVPMCERYALGIGGGTGASNSHGSPGVSALGLIFISLFVWGRGNKRQLGRRSRGRF